MRLNHFILFTALILTSCGSKPYLREEAANRLASPVWMIERDINTGPFDLRAFERMHERRAPATVYIEGDGFAKADSNVKNPTPRNPVALHLATRDLSDNVAYIARPCQYTSLSEKARACNPSYWREKRFAPEVVQAYNTALDDIRRRYDIEGFNLVGFDGGAAIAVLLAAQRGDVLTLRTVAGNLDTATYASLHQLPHLQGANPVSVASRLSNMPQSHFIGGQDMIIPKALVENYMREAGNGPCLRVRTIPQAGHEDGWVSQWPELLKDMPRCMSLYTYDDTPLERPADTYRPPAFPVSRERPEKP